MKLFDKSFYDGAKFKCSGLDSQVITVQPVKDYSGFFMFTYKNKYINCTYHEDNVKIELYSYRDDCFWKWLKDQSRTEEQIKHDTIMKRFKDEGVI